MNGITPMDMEPAVGGGAGAGPGETEAERRLLAAALAGGEADVSDLPESSRRVSAAFLCALLTREAQRLGPRGVRLRGARLEEGLDLAQIGSAQVPSPALALLDCGSEGGAGLDLDLGGASLMALDLSESRLARLEAPDLRLARGMTLRGMRLTAGAVVNLAGAAIEGDLELTGGEESEPCELLDLDGARIEGQVELAQLRLGHVTMRLASLGEDLLIGDQSVIEEGLTAGNARLRGRLLIVGAEVRLRGGLDLTDTEIGGQLAIRRGAVLSHPLGDALTADRAVIQGGVFVEGKDTRIEGETRLLGAKIGGGLAIGEGAVLSHPERDALSADGATIQGDVFVTGKDTRIEGVTRLPGATVGGQLAIHDGAVLSQPQGDALSGDRAAIQGGVFVEGKDTRIEGVTRLPGAAIGGQLAIRGGAVLSQPQGDALVADGVTVNGAVFVTGRDTRIEGVTRLPGATIGGQLAIRGGAVLSRPRGGALVAEGATIHGAVFVTGKDTRIEGETRLLGAEIGGQLAIRDGAVLSHPEGEALSANGATIRGGLFVRSLHPTPREMPSLVVCGSITLIDARVGPIDLRGAALEVPGGQQSDVALDARGLRVAGDVLLADAGDDHQHLSPARLRGALWLDRAVIEGALILTGAGLEPGRLGKTPEVAISLEGARVGARIECHGLPKGTRGVIDLRGAHTAFLDDDCGRGWGEPCRRDQPTTGEGSLDGILLRLDGFSYDRLPDLEEPGPDRDARPDVEARLAFLHRQYVGDVPAVHNYAPQPFEQAAKVLRAQGHPEQAEDIAREKRLFRTRCRVDRAYLRWLQHFLDWGFGHFYRPLRAIRTLAATIALGVVLLLLADATGALVKKRNEVVLPREQIAMLATQAPGPGPASPPREACWPPPTELRILWAPLAAAEMTVMSLDLLLPLVDLKQDQRCEVDWDRPVLGRFFGVLLAVYSALGLVILPLFIATVSGLARRD